MALTTSAAFQAMANQKKGTEPQFILAIQWYGKRLISNPITGEGLIEGGGSGGGGSSDPTVDTPSYNKIITEGIPFTRQNQVLQPSWSFYGDKAMIGQGAIGNIEPRIISVGNIDQTVTLDTNAVTSSVEIILDDYDVSLLRIFMTQNVYKRIGILYQYFSGLSLTDCVEIFQGEVVSSSTWSDKDQTFKVTLLSHIQGAEVGFSPEMGDIRNLFYEWVGQAWPTGFGIVNKGPTIQINKAPVAITQSPTGLIDASLHDEVTRTETLSAQWQAAEVFYALAALECYYSGYNDLGNQMTDLLNQCLIILQKVQTYTGHISAVLAAQLAFANKPVFVATDSPYALSGYFDIDGGLFKGVMSASDKNGIARFKIISAYHPLAASTGLPLPLGGPPHQRNFVFIQAGTQVTYQGNYTIRYVFNTLPSQVINVYANRTFGGLRELCAVPKKYYRHTSAQVASQQPFQTVVNAECIDLVKPLSKYLFQFWDDTIYVTYKCSLSDLWAVLIYIVYNFTYFTIDANSLANIPNTVINVCYNGVKDALELLQEICYQARVGFILRNGQIKFIYLLVTPSIGSLGSSSYVSGNEMIDQSLEIFFTDSEKILTKYVGTWKYDYSKDKDNRVVIRYNNKVYGLNETSHSFDIYKSSGDVANAMSFWAWRLGNVWKRIKFKVPIKYLTVEPYDAIVIWNDIVTRYYLANSTSWGGVGGNLVGRVVSNVYNPSDNLCEIEVELPVRLGHTTDEPYYSLDAGMNLSSTQEESYIPPVVWNGAFNLQLPFLEQLDQLYQGIGPQEPGSTKVEDDNPRNFFPDAMKGDTNPPGPNINNDHGTNTGEFAPENPNVSTLGTPSINPVTEPTFDYAYSDVTDNLQEKPIPPSLPTLGVITGGEGDDYDLTTFKGDEVQAHCFGHDPKDDIPDGTYVWLFGDTQTNENGDTSINWFFIPPVWLGSSPSTGP